MLSTIGAEHEHHMCGASTQGLKMVYKKHHNLWQDETERLANYLQKKGGKTRTLSRTFPYKIKLNSLLD